MHEKPMKDTVNLMTAKTLARLKDLLQKAIDDEANAKKAIGAAAGPESDWHDNAAYDHANIAYDVAFARLKEIKMKLEHYEIIEPRSEVDQVKVGNTVVIKFENEAEEEKFTILGLDDSGTMKDWISYSTPLAKSILDKKEGESAEFMAGGTRQTVKIIKILPGEF